jgi:hypothetical protein
MSAAINDYLARLERTLWLRRRYRAEVIEEVRSHLERVAARDGAFADADAIVRGFGAPRELAATIVNARPWWQSTAPNWPMLTMLASYAVLWSAPLVRSLPLIAEACILAAIVALPAVSCYVMARRGIAGRRLLDLIPVALPAAVSLGYLIAKLAEACFPHRSSPMLDLALITAGLVIPLAVACAAMARQPVHRVQIVAVGLAPALLGALPFGFSVMVGEIHPLYAQIFVLQMLKSLAVIAGIGVSLALIPSWSRAHPRARLWSRMAISSLPALIWGLSSMSPERCLTPEHLTLLAVVTLIGTASSWWTTASLSPPRSAPPTAAT